MAKIPDETIQPRSGMIFPDMEKISMAEKLTPRYNLQIMEAIYSQYTNDQGGMPYTGVDSYIDSLRTIARGRQSPDQYKKYFAGGNIPDISLNSDLDIEYQQSSNAASRKGWFTGMWESFNPIVNMKTMAKGKFLKQDADIKAFCIDANATVAEIEKMNAQWVKTKFKPMFNYLREQIGLPQDNTGGLNSYQELVDIKNEGAFKDKFIIAIEELIRHTEDISKWSTSLKEKLFDDIFDLGVAFAIADYDPTQCKVVWKYLDAKEVGVQHTLAKDFSDAQIFYWFEYWPLNKVRQMMANFQNSEGTSMGQADLESLATRYKNYHDNINSLWFSEKRPTDYNMADMRVCVMKGRWFDVKNTKTSEYIKNGKSRIVKYSEGQENRNDYKITNERELYRQDCTWIVGSDFVTGFGPAKNQAYINKNQPTLGFSAFKLMEKSYIERLVPIAHHFAIAFIRFTNSLAKAQDDFIEVNWDLIVETTTSKDDPLETIKMLRQENIFIKSTQGVDQQGGSMDAVIPRKGTIESAYKYLDIMERYLRLAEMVTGISPQTMGATPDVNLPVRNALLAQNSTEVSMSVLTNAVLMIKNDLGKLTIPMIKNLLDIDPRAVKNYGNVVGVDDVENIIESGDMLANMGIELYPRPTNEMVNELFDMANVSVQNGDLDPIELIGFRYHILRGGNFLQGLYQIRNAVMKEKQRKQQNQLEIQQEIGKQNQQSQQIAAQNMQDIQQQRAQQDNIRTANKAKLNAIDKGIDFANEMKSTIIKDQQEKGVDPTELLAKLQLLENQYKQQLGQTA